MFYILKFNRNLKEKLKYILTSGDCPSIDELQLYHEGKLSSDKKFEIEDHIAGCEICNDIIEGFSNVSAHDINKAEKEIKQRVAYLFYTEKKKKPLIIYKKIAVAASIILVSGTIFLVYKLYNSSPEIAEVKNKITETKITEKNAPVVAENDPVEIKAKKNHESQVVEKDKPLMESLGMENLELEKSSDIKLSAEEKETIDAQYEAEIRPMELSASGQQAFTEEEEKRTEEVARAEKKIVVWNDDEKIVEGKRTITGKVIDESGSPLPGVNVVFKGTKTATVTDQGGNYRIEVPEKGSVLQFNYIGFISEEVQIQTQDNIQIAMTPDIASLEEVVVIGYGTQKKSSTTRSTSKSEIKEDLNSKDEHKTELFNQIDSLQSSLKSKGEDPLIRKALAEKYLELQYRSDAIKELTMMKKLLSDSKDLSTIDSIIKHTENKDFNTALNLLKKLKL